MNDQSGTIEVKLSFQRKGNDGYDTFTLTFSPNSTEAERDQMRNLAFSEAKQVAERYYGFSDTLEDSPRPEASYANNSVPVATRQPVTSNAPQTFTRPSNGNVARIPWAHEGKFGKASYEKGTPISGISTDYLEWFTNYTKKKEGFWYEACVAELKIRQASQNDSDEFEEDDLDFEEN